jgi:hypothetical protein
MSEAVAELQSSQVEQINKPENEIGTNKARMKRYPRVVQKPATPSQEERALKEVRDALQVEVSDKVSEAIVEFSKDKLGQEEYIQPEKGQQQKSELTAAQKEAEFIDWLNKNAATKEDAQALIKTYNESNHDMYKIIKKINAPNEEASRELDKKIEDVLAGRSPETSEEKKQRLLLEQERLWREEPYRAGLNLAVEIINKRIIEEGGLPISVGDILYDDDFKLSAEFVDETGENKERWSLDINNKPVYTESVKDKNNHLVGFDQSTRINGRRILVRNLSDKKSERLGGKALDWNDKYKKICDFGIAAYEGQGLFKYPYFDNYAFFDDHCIVGLSPKSKEARDEYVDKMRLYLDNCLNNPDKVELKTWGSPQLEELVKETK